MTSLRNQLEDAYLLAAKKQQKVRVSTLRLIRAAIKDYDIASRGGGTGNTADETADDAAVLTILDKMMKQRHESIEVFLRASRADMVEREKAEIDVIQEFLPRQLSEAEIKAACEEALASCEATSLKDMGRVMKSLKAGYLGRMDFQKAGAFIKDLLARS